MKYVIFLAKFNVILTTCYFYTVIISNLIEFVNAVKFCLF